MTNNLRGLPTARHSFGFAPLLWGVLVLSLGSAVAMDADIPIISLSGAITQSPAVVVDATNRERPEVESTVQSLPRGDQTHLLPHLSVDSFVLTASPMTVGAPTPRRWLRNPVKFDLDQRPLADFLRDFCAVQGVAARISERLDGTVTGQFAFDDPNELLDLVARAQRINWYFDGVMVHFFAETEMESRLFPLDAGREAALRRTLDELGLRDERFPWRVADGGRLLMVQGPAEYLDRITETLARKVEVAASETPEKTLGVFRLKHAWAVERTEDAGTTRTRVPGVADLLHQIVAEQAAESETGSQPAESGTPHLMKGTGIVARRGAQTAPAATSASVPFIQADTRLNAVLVWDYPENMPRHQAIIEALDQPLALVEIRAAILDVEAGRTRDLGISWELSNQGASWNNNLGVNVGTGGGGVAVSGDGLQFATIYKRGLDQFMARVSAMEKDGTANVLSRPSVLTQDHIQATLEHTETFYVRLEGEREVDLADITTGLTLRVTPHVIQDEGGRNGVQLVVHIVDGTSGYSADGRVDDLPRVRQSSISTQAVVYEGEALVVGGYYTETRRMTKTGVPVLKNIPGVGKLFRRDSAENSKSERLFVLSPRIIPPGASPISVGSEAERTMHVSPGRDALEGPAFENRTPRPEDSLFWNNPTPTPARNRAP